MLPTPTAIEGVKWTNTWNPNSQMGQSLSAMAGSGMLPTPRTSEQGNNANVEADSIVNHKHLNLETVIGKVKRATNPGRAGETSRLSPLFTEEMMGFPFLWTALPFLQYPNLPPTEKETRKSTPSQSGEPKPSKPTATPSSPKSCTKSSEPSSK